MIQEPFWPQTADGIWELVAKVIGLGIFVGLTIWRVAALRLKDLAQIEAGRKKLDDELKDEVRLREAARLEAKQDLSLETMTRIARDEVQEKAMFELREALHTTVANVAILTNKVHQSDLDRYQIKIDIEKGLNAIQKQIAEGFARAFSWMENRDGK